MGALYLQCACGNAISPARWRAGKRTCTTCGIAKGIGHNLQMHEKNGDSFDHWKEAMRAILDSPSGVEEGNDNGCSG